MQIRTAYGAVGDVHNSILGCGDHGLGYLTQLDLFRAHPESRLHLLTSMRLVFCRIHWPLDRVRRW